MTCCTALLTVLSTDWSALGMVEFASITLEPLFTTSALQIEMGSGTNCTSGTSPAAADVEGWATGNAVAAAAAAGCRGCATFNSASDTAAEMEFVSVANTSVERVSCVVARAAFEGSYNWTG